MTLRTLVMLNLALGAVVVTARTVQAQVVVGARRDCCQINTEYQKFCCDDCCTSGDTCTSTQQCKDRPADE